MTVYKGVLQHIAGGQEYGKVGKFIRREFIDIGDQHIRGVQTTPYQDELLLSLIGKEITISGVGGKKGFTVVAIKTPDGEVHKGGIVGLILTTFLATIVGPIMGLMISIIFFIFGSVFWSLSPIIGIILILIGIGIILFFLFAPTIAFFKTLKVRTEL